jgi:chromosome segregation ATPase
METQVADANKALKQSEDARKKLERVLDNMSAQRQEEKIRLTDEYETKIQDLEVELSTAMKNFFQCKEEIKRLHFDIRGEVQMDLQTLQTRLNEAETNLASSTRKNSELSTRLRQVENENLICKADKEELLRKQSDLMEEVTRLEDNMVMLYERLHNTDNVYMKGRLVEYEEDND